MPIDYLHNHKEFSQLLNIVADEKGIIPQLIEKDYWIMHVLYGLKKQGFEFELKGGTSLSKLQTISTKFRKETETEIEKPNLMRQYYDVYCLLGIDEVRNFIGTQAYLDHKNYRFSKADLEIPISENEAYLLSDPNLRARFAKRYQDTTSLYYNGQPKFEYLLARIHEFLGRL